MPCCSKYYFLNFSEFSDPVRCGVSYPRSKWVARKQKDRFLVYASISAISRKIGVCAWCDRKGEISFCLLPGAMLSSLPTTLVLPLHSLMGDHRASADPEIVRNAREKRRIVVLKFFQVNFQFFSTQTVRVLISSELIVMEAARKLRFWYSRIRIEICAITNSAILASA